MLESIRPSGRGDFCWLGGIDPGTGERHDLSQRYLADRAKYAGIDTDSGQRQQISQAICTIRQNKLPDPARIGNAGSFFKNPVVSSATRTRLLHEYPALVSYAQTDGNFKLAAGWLIEQAGWRGKSLGQVGVYEKQALVLVNLGGATGDQVLTLSRAVQADVMQKFGVQLEVEPEFV